MLLFLTLSGLFGQDSIPLPDQATIVEKQFKPKVIDAKPIAFVPRRSSTDQKTDLTVSYKIPRQIFTINYPDPVIKPLVYEEKKIKQNFKDGYLKLGYGLLNSPLVESQFHYDIQDFLQTGFSFRHYSGSDTLPDVFRSISKTNAELYASYFLTDQTKLTAELNYQNDNRSLCCTDAINLDELERTQLDNYGLALRLDHNSFSVKGFSSKQNIYANRVHSKLNDHSEYNLGYNSSTNKTIGQNIVINLPISFDYFASDLWTENPYQLTTRPNGFYKNDNFSMRVGAFIATKDSLFVRPDFEFSYLLPWYNLEAKTSYKANSEVNSLTELYRISPYHRHMSSSNVSYTEREEIKLGVLFKNKKADFYIGGLLANLKDAFLIVFNENGFHDFRLVDYKGFGIEMKLDYNLNKTFSFKSNLLYRNFTESPEKSLGLINPSYIPQILVNLQIQQTFFNSLVLYETLNFIGRRNYEIHIASTYMVDEIDSIVDLGVGLEYIFKNKIGIFAEANNLLNQSYQRFYLDNSFKLNYHLGFKFLF